MHRYLLTALTIALVMLFMLVLQPLLGSGALSAELWLGMLASLLVLLMDGE